MRPWIFWRAKVKATDAGTPEIISVRVVVVEPAKYIIEHEGIRGALGEMGWMDAYEMGGVAAAVLEAPFEQIAEVANKLYNRGIAGKAVLHL